MRLDRYFSSKSGLSLVEVMFSSVVGIMILGMITVLYVGANNSMTMGIALAEINSRFAREKGIRVVRRMSGGGAVYHDSGNLNYSFIRRYDHNTFANVKSIIRPVVAALNQLGVPAWVNSRNDIILGNKKISGNAQFSNTKGIIIHGTLLFDSELDTEEKVLGDNHSRIESKAR